MITDPVEGAAPPKGEARRPHLGRLIVSDLRVLVAPLSVDDMDDRAAAIHRAKDWIERLCDWSERNRTILDSDPRRCRLRTGAKT